jgi:predicted alpha-1,6-mannanase (GH76 family)
MKVRSGVVAAVLLGLATLALLLSGCGGTTSQSAPSHSTQAQTLPAQPGSSAPSVGGSGSARVQAALAAFTTAFYVQTADRGFFKRSTAGGLAVFWTEAEMIEMVEDVYQSTGNPADKQMVVALMTGFLHEFGGNWTAGRTYNDDIMWMIIASLRAYDITGNVTYRNVAKLNFDRVYARSWDRVFGGGLWWTTDKSGKNTTTTAPAIIAACLLYQTLHERAYLVQAVDLYAWQRRHLFDAHTGAVFDGVTYASGGGSQGAGSGLLVTRTRYTYNQGTFIGAAALLYQATAKAGYYDDALAALRYSKASLTRNDILQGVGESSQFGNRGGFKGIFARWAGWFVSQHHLTSYDAWFRQNAAAAWSQRNSRGLMGPNWFAPTGNGELTSFGCSSAVVMQAVANSLPAR